MGVGLVLLACHTAFNILADKGGEAWPPELGGDKLAGFEEARVSGRFMIMAVGKDGMAKGVISGNINTAFIGEDSCLHLPVSKAGAEQEGNIFVHRLKRL